MNVLSLTRDLLKIPSPSGEERAIGEFLVKRLQKNFTVTVQPIGERCNILATRGKPNLLLTTHMDTVCGLLPVAEDDFFLYGRGACDTKGIIAAMICAAEEAARTGYTDFGLLFDVSEETDFSGIKEAIKLVNPDFVIVGEPTNMNVAIGQKGLIGIQLKYVGIAAPGATPEAGTSAIELLIDDMNRLRRLDLPRSNLGKTTLNIGLVKGGSAANVVADAAEATIEIRSTVANKVVLGMLGNTLRGECEIKYAFEPVFARDFLRNTELERIVVPYFTEMYFWEAKAVVIGPGAYADAHTANEKIAKEELVKGKELYLTIIKEMGAHNLPPLRDLHSNII